MWIPGLTVLISLFRAMSLIGVLLLSLKLCALPFYIRVYIGSLIMPHRQRALGQLIRMLLRTALLSYHQQQFGTKTLILSKLMCSRKEIKIQAYFPFHTKSNQILKIAFSPFLNRQYLYLNILSPIIRLLCYILPQNPKPCEDHHHRRCIKLVLERKNQGGGEVQRLKFCCD